MINHKQDEKIIVKMEQEEEDEMKKQNKLSNHGTCRIIEL